jgi:hypothetical protein
MRRISGRIRICRALSFSIRHREDVILCGLCSTGRSLCRYSALRPWRTPLKPLRQNPGSPPRKGIVEGLLPLFEQHQPERAALIRSHLGHIDLELQAPSITRERLDGVVDLRRGTCSAPTN